KFRTSCKRRPYSIKLSSAQNLPSTIALNADIYPVPAIGEAVRVRGTHLAGHYGTVLLKLYLKLFDVVPDRRVDRIHQFYIFSAIERSTCPRKQPEFLSFGLLKERGVVTGLGFGIV